VRNVQKLRMTQTILYNGFEEQQQNHLYIIVSNNLKQQRELYNWYLKLHACAERTGHMVCNTCASCRQIDNGNYINNTIVQRHEDRARIGLDVIADLQETFSTKAHIHGARFFCIEEAERLTVQAMNSVLKFLEDPQGHTIGFLFTTNESKLLPTIRSRGQILRLVGCIDAEQERRVAKKLPTTIMQTAAHVLLLNGHDERIVIKQVPLLYDVLTGFFGKLSRGVSPIVAQMEMEAISKKTKTGTMVLEMLVHVLECFLKDDALPDIDDADLVFVARQWHNMYLAAYEALDKKRYHFGASMLFTTFSLDLMHRCMSD